MATSIPGAAYAGVTCASSSVETVSASNDVAKERNGIGRAHPPGARLGTRATGQGSGIDTGCAHADSQGAGQPKPLCGRSGRRWRLAALSAHPHRLLEPHVAFGPALARVALLPSERWVMDAAGANGARKAFGSSVRIITVSGP